jgi:hypothetical protein
VDAQQRGDVVLAGALLDPADMVILVFPGRLTRGGGTVREGRSLRYRRPGGVVQGEAVEYDGGGVAFSPMKP